MFYDAHCHLDLMKNMDSTIKNINNIVLAVGTTPKAYCVEQRLCKNNHKIHVGLGLHPQIVSSGYDDIELFERLICYSHYIGEVGLDFSSSYVSNKVKQIEIFKKIIALCDKQGNKVVSLHSLKSAETVIDILNKYGHRSNNIYIFHWFTGTLEQMEKAIQMGCYFSINPEMIKTTKGIRIIRELPVDRILLETDAPFGMKLSYVFNIDNILKSLMRNISVIKGFDISDEIEKTSNKILK